MGFKKDRSAHLGKDVNFDAMAEKFQRKIYGTLKGKIRLAVLERDLGEFCPRAMGDAEDAPMKILDAGCGSAPFSLEYLGEGHLLTLCDISEKMLDQARKRAAALMELSGPGVRAGHISFLSGAIQDLAFPEVFDLVLCHAVLEWVVDPRELLNRLAGLVRPGGMLSLAFYNLHGLVFKNLLWGNYKKIINQDYHGRSGSLTPAHPRKPEEVLEWVDALPTRPLELLCRSGMRVFHDYSQVPPVNGGGAETIVNLELQFSRVLPYRDLGRYQHLLFRRR